MKTKIGILILTFAVTTAWGQTTADRFSYAATVGTGIAMSTPSKTPVTGYLLGYYKVSSRWAVGLGTGLAVYEKTLLPVFATAKFRIAKPRLFTPYLECGVGYSFALSRNTNGGLYWSPTLGTEVALSPHLQLLVGLGYEFQALERLKTHQDNYFSTAFQEHLSHNTIALKVGVAF